MSPDNVAGSSDDRGKLVQLTEELIERMREGLPVDRDGYLARYPDYAQQLGELIDTLLLVADLASSDLHSESTLDSIAENPTGNPGLGTLGDFRLLREIGRGGMGVVYEADQLSLGRLVALKVLPFAAVLDKRQLQRFKHEAQAAASLHHPNIVPVFGVGCHRGVHYIAMQLIRGHTLATVIHELCGPQGDAQASTISPLSDVTSNLCNGQFAPPVESAGHGNRVVDPQHQSPVKPLPPGRDDVETSDTVRTDREVVATMRSKLRSSAFFRTVARLGIQAADALQYAHEHGVVHRDIKPANLILDNEGRLWVTDFGLAQLETETGVTMSGDVLGTVRYMSPEQAHVQAGMVDHRTDIYSLGVTLCELLTQRPAYDGPNRQSLLREIAAHQPRPPRALNAVIPRQLETVFLKAMRRSPGERYASAAELADDLQRFLDHKPIHAKPPTLTDRMAKWALRNRRLVLAVVVLLVLASVGLFVSNRRSAHQRNLAREAAAQESMQRGLADRERSRAKANYRLALEAINEMLHRVAGDQLKSVPQMQKVRIDLSDRAVKTVGRTPPIRAERCSNPPGNGSGVSETWPFVPLDWEPRAVGGGAQASDRHLSKVR
jgi:serine/threonine protein kinase